MATSATTRREDLTGLVICGGQGRRMSADGAGTDKGFVSFRGRALVLHVLERLRPQVGQVLLNAPNAERWMTLPDPRVTDQFQGSIGPLAGLHAGLIAARTAWILSVPCDTPLLPADLAIRMIEEQRRSGARSVSVQCGNHRHPIFTLISVSLATDLYDFLNKGGRKVEDWLNQVGTSWCEFPDPLAFTNLNTPQDLETLERL